LCFNLHVNNNKLCFNSYFQFRLFFFSHICRFYVRKVLFCFAEDECYLHNIDTIILFFPGTWYREIWCSLKLNTPLLHWHHENFNPRNLPAIRYKGCLTGIFFNFQLLPLDKWDWCKIGTLMCNPGPLRLNRRFLNKLYYDVKYKKNS
jgi:hypothetical protein